MFSKCCCELHLSSILELHGMFPILICCCFELAIRSTAILTWAHTFVGDFFLIFKCCSLVSRLSWVYGLCLQPGIFLFPILREVEKIGNFFFFLFLPKLENLDEIKLLWKHRFGPKNFVAMFVTNNKHHNTKYSEFWVFQKPHMDRGDWLRSYHAAHIWWWDWFHATVVQTSPRMWHTGLFLTPKWMDGASLICIKTGSLIF